MTALPDDGATVWQITGPAGTRLTRIREGAGPLTLPPGQAAVPVTGHDAETLAAAAPRFARIIWQLTEAQAPRWGWMLRKVPHDGGPVAIWSLTVAGPGGPEHRFTWVRHGGVMRLEAQTTTLRAVLDRLGGSCPEEEAA